MANMAWASIKSVIPGYAVEETCCFGYTDIVDDEPFHLLVIKGMDCDGWDVKGSVLNGIKLRHNSLRYR